MEENNIVELGTIYFGEEPVPCGFHRSDIKPRLPINRDMFYIADSVDGKRIPFIRWKNLLVASKPVCTEVSWEDLNKAGYIYGRPVIIDGKPYLCRSLKVGTKAGDPNEWDQLVSEYPNASNRYLHWKDTYFWGQESGSSVIHRVVRGYISAREYGYLPKDTCTRSTGFRPVLEELPPVPDDLSSLIGKDIAIYGQETDIFGILKQVTDYDLVIAPSLTRSMEASAIVTDSCKWATWDNGNIAVNRNAPIWIEESKF